MAGTNPYPHRSWILGVLCLALIVGQIDTYVVNVALPGIARDLSATTGQLQWIVDAYVLLFAGLLLTGGSLSDRYGRKLVLLSGLCVFLVGSVMAALAGSVEVLIIGRGVAGAGAALIMPCTLSTVTHIYTGTRERARAIAIWSAVSGAGGALGPIIGGGLVESFGWRAIFWINVPILVVSIAGTVLLVPSTIQDGRPRPLDPVGAVLSVAGLGLVLWCLIAVPDTGIGAPSTLGTLVAGLALLIVFVLWELRKPAVAMLDVTVFRGPRFTPAVANISIGVAALAGALFLLPIYLQSVRGFGALVAGLGIAPIPVSLACGSLISTPFALRFGTRVNIMTGMAMIAAGIGGLAAAADTGNYAFVCLALIFAGGGIGFGLPSAARVILKVLPASQAGAASAVTNLAHEVPAAIGVAVYGTIFTANYGGRIADRLGNLSLPPGTATQPIKSGIAGALTAAGRIGGSVGSSLADAARHAFVGAMQVSLGVAAATAAVGLLLALRLPANVEDRPASAPAPDEGHESEELAQGAQ